MYETGGMRRVWVRGHENVRKRVLIQAAACNIGLLLRRQTGVGTPRSLQGRAVSAICRLIGRLIDRWGRLRRAWGFKWTPTALVGSIAHDRPLGASEARLGVQMDPDGARRLNRSSPSCLNSGAQRTDFFHGLLEIYKLHAELADRVSQRREGANRLYVSLLVGLMVFLAALLRYGTGDLPAKIVLSGIGIIGALLSGSWYGIIRSHRQLNSGKFKTLHELEKKLAYPFFTREWDLLAEGLDRRRYWKLRLLAKIT